MCVSVYARVCLSSISKAKLKKERYLRRLGGYRLVHQLLWHWGQWIRLHQRLRHAVFIWITFRVISCHARSVRARVSIFLRLGYSRSALFRAIERSEPDSRRRSVNRPDVCRFAKQTTRSSRFGNRSRELRETNGNEIEIRNEWNGRVWSTETSLRHAAAKPENPRIARANRGGVRSFSSSFRDLFLPPTTPAARINIPWTSEGLSRGSSPFSARASSRARW